MIWRKSWWECRFRVLLAAGISVSFCVGRLLPLWMGNTKEGAFAWDLYLGLLAGVVVPMVAVLMAGSGINTQTSHGMLHGYHPSMYFFLSLPVSRREALLTRTALGAIFTILFIVITVGAVRILGPIRGPNVTLGNSVAAIVFMTIGALGFFGLNTFLTTVFDELWAGMTGMALVGFFFGFGEAVQSIGDKHKGLQVLGFMTGQQFAQTGEISWFTVAFFLLVGAGCLMASIYVVEKKEY